MNILQTFLGELVIFFVGVLGVLLLYLRGKSRVTIRSEETALKFREATFEYFIERVRVLENTISELRKYSENWEARYLKLFADYADLRENYVRLQGEKDRLESEISLQNAKIKSLYDAYTASKTLINTMQAELTRLKAAGHEPK